MDKLDMNPKGNTSKPRILIRGAGFTKIDRFWLFLILSLLILIILVFLTFRGVFSAIKTAGELDEELIGQETHVNQELLDKAYQAVFE